jgi:predicted nucleic acid-binding protein
MVLVDTSVWIDHLRNSTPDLVRLLESEEVLTHPFIIGELACGRLQNRASDAEVLALIEKNALMGKGAGYLDMHLLASLRLAVDARLWTRDKRLAQLAEELSVLH